MKIIQQPDILSFAGNMNDFVIEDVAKSLVFKLSVDGMVIVDEVYVAEGGEVRVSMKDIVDCFLSISIPRADSDYIIQSLAVKKFKAEIEDSVIEFTVVKGGISNVAESSAVFLKTQWLTLQPQEKRIVMHQPEYLSYYAMVACLIKMTVYLADGSANETLLALEAGNLYTVDVSYLKISGKFDRVVGCYDVWVENEAGQRLTYVQRYILSQSNTETNVYLFENTLGGIDSVVFTGRFTEKIQTEGTVTTVLEESTDSDIDLNFSCEQNTGFIPSIDYARWLRSFFVSKQRYHVAGALRRIYLRESENGFTKNSLNDFTFEFFYSKQTKYDVVTRNRDDLPHLLEFPEVDSIPFLAPRLAEFPIAVVADDLMLPVQYAFENAWRRISIAAITQAVSEGAIDKIDLSSYWKKTELVRDGLYLKFLDKYIRAKFADDSKLFDKHAWEDWFNQALRTFDDVKFKSLRSTEFETKVKGWIIDAMGDAEFRKLILREGFKTADFIPGVVGSGTGMVGTEDFTTGKLTVRNYMEVMALAVARVFWRGGRDVHSPSGMKVNKVEEYDDYWRCYMETSEGQKNTCTIGAQMRCDKYGDGKEKYYWNLVMGIGEDYIDLSKTDRDGVDVPEVGDELAQFGHRTDPNLSWILVISSMMEDAGMTMYAGVNSYTLSGKWAISMGKDPNGSNRVGVFTKNGEFSDIIEGLEEKIQDAIVKTIDITASSQVFKYGPGFTGNPIPATITLTAMASKIAPESYQWQFLHGTGWVNIENATKKTLDVMPGDPVLFPSGTNVRSFRCVCNGDESFTDVFTLAKLADGAAGKPGTDGKGISSTAVTYQASTNGTTVPTGTWENTIPSVSANQYLWTRTIITYTDNTTSTSYSIGKMGATGAAGAAGKDACTVLLTNEAHTVACDANGNPLPGELAKATTKATAYKGTTKLTGVSTTGDLGAGKFSIGTKQETGGTFAWNGVDGVKCTTMTADTASCTFRVYLESASVYVEKTFIVTKAKSGENYWKTDVWLDASSYDADKWIPFTGTPLSRIGYNRICVSVALNSGTKPAWSTHNSGFSVDFDVDMQASGWGATDAQTLIYVDTFKFCSSSPVSCGQMTYSSTPVLYLRGGGKYHVKTDFPVTWTPRPDGYTWTSGSYTQSVSPQTSRPKPVGTSIIGRGVRSVANKYAVSSSNTTAPTSWSDTVPSTTTTNRYLWNYEIITYTDGTTAETNKRVIGVHGATGATGVGIKSITEYYLASASASGVTTSTSGWTTGMQVTTTTKKYLWNYEIVTYTDNSKYTSTPVIIGTHGATGDKGDTGAAGKGVKSTAIVYQASSSGTTTPTGTWSSSVPAVAAGQYLWTRTIITYTDNTTSTMYSVGRMGTNGMNGNAGNGVSSTAITYQASTSGTTAPTGTWSSSIPTVAAGSYLWTRTIISYTNGTSSTIYSVGKMGNTGAQGQPGESINGKMLYRDPEFKVGLNGTRTYGAQNGGGTVVISRTKKSTGQNQAGSLTSTEAAQIKEKLAGSPYSESDWCLYIKCHGGTSTGHLGGFYFGNQSRANAVFIVKVSAKIPVGYTLKNAHNSHGTGYKQEFLTPMVGTGKYETYIFKETCGPTGTFNTVNHLYLSGPVTTEAAPCEWFVDYATVFDQTSDGYADIEIVTKDSFAVQLGFTSFEALKANALTKGPLIKAGLINADVIDVNTLAANNAFIDKLRTNILKANVITANMISVIGFTFADNKIIGGKDFGVGPGVKVTSTDSEKSFKAYKDASNYISMYYNSASDWGLKGVVGGAELLKLGITNKLGPFAIEGSWLRGSNLALSGSQLNFSYSGHQVYVGSHPDMTTAGNAKLGTFMLSGGGYGGLGSNKQVALIAGAPNNVNSYAMAVTQGMLKMFSNAHIVSGVSRAYMTGTNPGITLGNEHPNMICLYGTGNRKKVNLYAGMEIGSHFFITSEASQGFDVLCTGSERFYRNGNTYVAVQSSGQDTVLVMKTDTYKWTACQLPINWLGTWNP